MSAFDSLDAIARPLVDAAVRGAVVLLLALVITHLMRRRSAAARHLVWVGAVVIQLLLPVFAIWGPKWELAIPGAVANVSPIAIPSATTRNNLGSDPAPTPVRSVSDPAPTPLRPGSDPVSDPVSDPKLTGRQLLLALWAAGAAFVLIRLAAGTAIVARLARKGNRVDDGNWLSLAQRLSASLQIDRPLTLLRGTKIGVPVTWGIVYPVVLLPDDSDSWPEERRRFVLVHEMAHVKRLDALTQLAGQFALALFWFDPLVWIANRRMQMEREHACDDYVLRHGTSASTYAEELLTMVRSLGTSDRSSQPAFAALAMARRSEFEGRMLSILDPVLDRHPLSKVRTFASALAALVLVVPLAALHPYQRLAPAAAVAQAQTADGPTVNTSVRDELPESFKINILPVTPQQATRPLTESVKALAAKTTQLATATTDLAKKVGSATVKLPNCDTVQLGTEKSGTSTHIHASDASDGRDVVDYVTYNALRCSSASISGRLKYSPREDDVLEMPQGSHAAFRQRSASDDRELVLTRTADNTIHRSYRRNGAPSAYDDNARQWFGTYLPFVLREAGLNIAPRVARWRNESGVNGTLANIATISGSSAKRQHYEALLTGGEPLSGEELDHVVRGASQTLTSSGDLRAVLLKAAPAVRLSRQGMTAVERAVMSISSSGDKAAVLRTYGQTDDREMLLGVMRATATISSSGDRARLLQVLVDRYLTKNDRALEDAYFNQLDQLPSSGDMRNTMMMVVPHATKSVAVAKQLLQSTHKVVSSGDRSAVLIRIVSSGALTTKELRDQFFAATANVPSDSDRARVLQAAVSLMQ